MSLRTWIHHILEPHCPECRADSREKREEGRVCLSCETLSRQLEIANHNNEQLLDKLLKEPEPTVVKALPTEYKPPRQIPWAMRRQMLESEDREKAKLMRSGIKPDVAQVPIKDLEKELGVEDVNKDSEAEDKDAIG